ncbi:MAG: hypothetical protein ACOC5T_08695 [Elusimicrobiota bacterium]
MALIKEIETSEVKKRRIEELRMKIEEAKKKKTQMNKPTITKTEMSE